MSDDAVIQTRFEPIDLEVLVSVLTQAGGMPHADASRVARRSRGILWEHIGKEKANAVCDELMKRDIGVRVVARGELPDLPDPRTIGWLLSQSITREQQFEEIAREPDARSDK